MITAHPAGLSPAQLACLPNPAAVLQPQPGSFPPASAPSQGPGQSGSKNNKGDSAAGLSSWIHGEERSTQEAAGPSRRLKGQTSHPPAHSGIQTLGGGRGRKSRDPSYGEGEPGEKGVCSLVPCREQPQTQRERPGLGEELGTYYEEQLLTLQLHSQDAEWPGRQVFQKKP